MGYLAETLLHHTPGARGGVAHDEQDPEAYVHEGQPALLGLAQPDVHLWTGMAIAAGRVRDRTDDEPALPGLRSNPCSGQQHRRYKRSDAGGEEAVAERQAGCTKRYTFTGSVTPNHPG